MFLDKNISELKEDHSQKGNPSFLRSVRFIRCADVILRYVSSCLLCVLQSRHKASPTRRSTGSLCSHICLKATEKSRRPSRSVFTCCWEQAWERRYRTVFAVITRRPRNMQIKSAFIAHLNCCAPSKPECTSYCFLRLLLLCNSQDLCCSKH